METRSSTARAVDRLYSEPEGRPAPFVFDERVASVFEDMIERSVPGYSVVVAATGAFCQHFARPGTRVYDLGCSLGAGAQAMLHGAADGRGALLPGLRVIAVDDSRAMVERCRARFCSAIERGDLEVHQESLLDTAVTQASFVALNFTLQFLAPSVRNTALARIHAGMQAGGGLLLSEKFRAASPARDETLRAHHEAFKRSNGYSDLEIATKRAALERVLIPDTVEQLRSRLLAAGFGEVTLWYRRLNFVSLIARA